MRAAGERLAVGRERRHHAGAAPERGDRYAAAHDLAERSEIGRNAESTLRATQTKTKPRDDLVKNQQRAPTACARSQTFEKAALRWDQAHVRRDRLDQDRCNLMLHTGGRRVDRIEIVVARHQRLAPRRRRNTAAPRTGRGAGVEQSEIEMPVVVAGKLQYPLALRV